MNLEKVFNFIKEKRGYDYPVKYKLVNGIELTEDELNIEGNLDLSGRNIKSLPDNLHVDGNLLLFNTNIISLPNNLHVGGTLHLSNTKITSLPDNLKVGENLDLRETPISKMYTEEEIRKMIEDKGGYVKGSIKCKWLY
jgi:hypothetical protein